MRFIQYMRFVILLVCFEVKRSVLEEIELSGLPVGALSVPFILLLLSIRVVIPMRDQPLQ